MLPADSLLSRISRNNPCPCGSGQLYKHCCRGGVPRTPISQFNHDGDESGLGFVRHCRANFVRYWAWHKAHTEQGLTAGIAATGMLGSSDSMARVDMEAFSELLYQRLIAYRDAGIARQFLDDLSRLESASSHADWPLVIRAQRAFYYYAAEGDEVAGAKELRSAGDWRNIQYESILQLWLDLLGTQLSSTDRLDLCRHLVAVATSQEATLQYSGLLGLMLIGFGDSAEALATVNRAIGGMEETKASNRTGTMVRFFEARLLILRGDLTGAVSDYRRATEELISLLTEPGVGAGMKGMLHLTLAEGHEGSRDLSTALRHAEIAVQYPDLTAARVVRMRLLLKAGRPKDAIEAADAEWHQDLHPGFRLELLEILGLGGVAEGDVNRVADVVGRLPSLTDLPAELMASRANLSERLAAFLVKGALNADDRGEPEGLGSALSKIIMMRPNFHGVGLDLNALFAWLTKRRG